MENDGLAKLRFDTFIAGTEALALIFPAHFVFLIILE